MELLSAYMPMDRRQALLKGNVLPTRARGSALFADISGFTPLTNALVQELGPTRGAEEVTRHVNRVFDALIAQLQEYQGSVIGFSGDAITCWLDGDYGLRAVVCGLAMQNAMKVFETVQISPKTTVSLAMKVAIANGHARRFLVGNPEIQLVEILAGSTLERLAAAEHQAERGEVVVDGAVADFLDEYVRFSGWRVNERTGSRVGLATDVKIPVSPSPWPEIPADAFPPEKTRPWLLPAVYERIASGLGEFLTEFRPAAIIFITFGGIDYDGDESSGEKLDAYIRAVQNVLMRYDGNLIQVTVGDKGSYLMAAFGAPVAHEDYVERAVAAALELGKLAPVPEWEGKIKIGISMGRLRTGAYGGTMSRTYGVLGNETNLSARLMQAAYPGQILVTKGVREEVGDGYDWEQQAPMLVKGRTDPITTYSLCGSRENMRASLEKAGYSLPMVGRQEELKLASEKLDKALEGHGQIIGIVGEAGIGKSRLVTEILQLPNMIGMLPYGGECQSYGMASSYQVWQNIWRSIFRLDPSWDEELAIAALEAQLRIINIDLLPRMPLLSSLLKLNIPDNELTQSLDAKLRKASLESLLVDCLTAKAQETPMLLVLENIQWIDPLSYDLLDMLGRATANLPVLIILAFRPSEKLTGENAGLIHLSHFTTVPLVEFTVEEEQQLIQLKIDELYGTHQTINPRLVEMVSRRTEGNPFYIEELLNYLFDQGVDPQDSRALEQLDLPSSLHSLILTRIDQRTESQKITLKVASIVGRVFIAAWLWGAYPELGDASRVKTDLEILNHTEIEQAHEPELTYLFRQIVIQEVTYDSLPYSIRSVLHDQLARFIEENAHDKLNQYIDLLAYHYSRSANQPKKREYLQLAGEAAQSRYANEAAIQYYLSLLPLLSDEEKLPIQLKLGEVFEIVGRWDDAKALYHQALEVSTREGEANFVARCQTAIGELFRKRGEYEDAATWLLRALNAFETMNDKAGVGKVLQSAGTLAVHQGNRDTAQSLYEKSLDIRRELDDKLQIANLLNNLGILARHRGDYQEARRLQTQGLEIRQEIGDRFGLAHSLTNLGIIAMNMGDFEAARKYSEDALKIYRDIGSKFYIANELDNLGNVARTQGDLEAARQYYSENLSLNRELGDGRAIAYSLEGIGSLAALSGQSIRALCLAGAASALREKMGAPLPENDRLKLEERIAAARRELSEKAQTAAWERGRQMDVEEASEYAAQV
jgi:predicted ATPase/class 3 adenylate cyclase